LFILIHIFFIFFEMTTRIVSNIYHAWYYIIIIPPPQSICLSSQRQSFLINLDCIYKSWLKSNPPFLLLLLFIGMVFFYICMLTYLNNFNCNILWSFHYRLLNLVDKWIRNISLWIQHFAWNYFWENLFAFTVATKIYTTYRAFI
jgi:hypothetical protein